ncbi:MAG: alpha/beta hydrolase [Pseudobdellovibrionaceae bacterium]|nr:alpha/beta hydrolase [Bdellovibrionales bacterium]USN46827.1 MAG: alpha/beta hydrolase [Pseudobdellovibrionaceae bacterium]
MSKILKSTGYVKSFDGSRIYYEIRGQGKPIVMAYGIGCLINHWQHQIKYFSENYQTIVFDYRAHHNSEIPMDRSNISIDALARDIKYLLDHLEISKASFFGHSFGTQVLIRCIDIYPQFFDNLIFINGFASNPIRGMFGTDLVTKVFQNIKQGYDFLPETFRELWRVTTNNSLAIQLSALAGGFNINLTHLKDIEIYSRGISSVDLEAFLRLFENMMNYDGRPVFDRIDVPVLIIGGSKDSVTPQKYQEEMHVKIRNSQFLMVPYGSHCTQLDMPEYVNLRIEKFLKALAY